MTALALSHSTLHKLVIPHIYSRFDIVWPDHTIATEPRSGVDALTYGLSTLVMGRDVFQTSSVLKPSRVGRRRGNDFARHTRKFSLGNGPQAWVQEYLITKESGKMLGTLVTLAVARMVNLESFTWDMPTGVVRDVWEALASLGDRADQNCRLESVWVRCHAAKETHAPSGRHHHGHHQHATHNSASGTSHHHSHHHHSHTSHSSRDSEHVAVQKSYHRVESPNFSILPPLKKIAALDIDELAYLEELSKLVDRSYERLKELRLSASLQCDPKTWFLPEQRDASRSHGLAGGVLGFIFKGIYDGRQLTKKVSGKSGKLKNKQTEGTTQVALPSSSKASAAPKEISTNGSSASLSRIRPKVPDEELPLRTSAPKTRPTEIASVYRPSEKRKLYLEVLELSNIPLYNKVLINTIDWTHLTALTLLNCNADEDLWKMLRKKFAPDPPSPNPSADSAFRYKLHLKRIRTNGVTPTLLAVLKETLAPNSVEWLLLQDRSNPSGGSTSGSGAVTVEQIFRGPLRRHQESLKKARADQGCEAASQCDGSAGS